MKGVSTGFRLCASVGCRRRRQAGSARCWDCDDGRAPGSGEKRLRAVVSEDDAELALEMMGFGSTLSAAAGRLGVQIIPLQRAVRRLQRTP